MSGGSWPSGDYFGGSGDGGNNPTIAALTQMLLPVLTPKGMTPGQFQPNQNLLDTQAAREFEQGRLGASMAVGGAEAAETLQQMVTGSKPGGGLVGMGVMSAAQGKKASELFQSADFGRGVGMAMPTLGMMMPGAALDEMGMGGQQAANSYANMSRGKMQIPGQPGTGLTSDQLKQQTTQITAQLHRDLFSGSDRTQTRGMPEGQMGALSQQAQQMGRGPGDFFNQSDEQRNEYTRDLSKSTSAIRDLGGDFANLNPEQTMGMLDMVNQGGFSRGVSNTKLESQTRQFKQLTRAASITEAEGVGLQQTGGQRAEQLGGDALSGVMAGQHAMAFGAGLKKAGLGETDGVSVNEMMQQDAVLTAQAGRSETGNMAAALMRMGEAGMIREGTGAYKMLGGLKKGEFSAITPGKFREMLDESGVDMGAAAQILQQRGQNFEMFGDDVAGAVRETQWDADVGAFMQRMVANSIGSANRQRGYRMSTQQAMAIGKAVADTIREMAGKPHEEVRAAIATKFEAMGASQQDAMAAAEMALGAAGNAAHGKGYKGTGHAASMHSREALAWVRKQQKRAEAGAEAEIDMAPDARTGAAGRIIEAFQEGNPKVARFVARMGGAVEIDKEAADERRARESTERGEAADAGPPVPVTREETDAMFLGMSGDDSAFASHGVEQPMDSR